MAIRITNSIMTNNTKANININKLNADKLNTMMASGQKITRPSDDPIIAIRALRLNTNISEINQYYEKNIPDADAWMKVTESALMQTDTILAKIKESLTQGASDDNTADDRMNILEDLKGMRDQIYSAGNADYAGRTVFTGYRTSEPLTFKESETNRYTIKEEFTASDVEKIKYVSGDFDVDVTNPQDIKEQSVNQNDVYRIRLAYDNLMATQTARTDPPTDPLKINVVKADGTVTSLATATVVSLTGNSATDDDYYTNPPAEGAYLIADTGELILGENLRNTLQNIGDTDRITFEYDKEKFEKNDLRPEHYFQCVDGKNIEYNRKDAEGNTLAHFENQDISYEISFNQSITINTHANETFTHDICRDVDELIAATQAVVDAEDKIKKLEQMKDDPQYSEAQLKNIDDMLTSATKERDLLKDKMQSMFSRGLTSFDNYMDRNNLALSQVGSMRSRLELTKERAKEQQTSFKTLADENININLTDTAIDLTNAKNALEAAQLAASKTAQQTLLNYL